MPLGGGMVKREWLKFYGPNDLPERFDQIIQSWDTANNRASSMAIAYAQPWAYLKDAFTY